MNDRAMSGQDASASASTVVGHRGYIVSRPLFGDRTAQHVQNLVVREHARRHGLTFLLSATEYAMPHCYMMLEDLVAGAGRDHSGIILFSLFALPRRAERRQVMIRRVLEAGGRLDAALEDLTLTAPADIERWEDLWRIRDALGGTGGHIHMATGPE